MIGGDTAFEPLMAMMIKEQYDDVLEEFIKSVISINSELFYSRLSGQSAKIREIADRFRSYTAAGAKC